MADKIIPASPSAEDYAKAAANSPDDGAWFARNEPFALFAEWLEDAKKKEPNDANAMALATADEHGAPDVRMVLLKDVSGDGFVFYSNAESRKGQQLAANAQAALCFHWKSLRRQVRVSGKVEPATRGRGRRLFCLACEGQPDRRVGVRSVAPDGGAVRTGEAHRAGRHEVWHREDAASAALARLAHRADAHRVLARQAVPPARPAGVHALRRRPAMDDTKALPLRRQPAVGAGASAVAV
jgi:hypothetical protein